MRVFKKKHRFFLDNRQKLQSESFTQLLWLKIPTIEIQVTCIGARFTSPSTVEGGSIFGMILLTRHKHTCMHTTFFLHKTLPIVEGMKGMNYEDILQKLTDLPMSHLSTTFYPIQSKVFPRMNSNSDFTFPSWFHSAHMNHSKNVSLK